MFKTIFWMTTTPMISILVSLTFMFSTHPISLIIGVLIQTTLVCVAGLLTLQSPWFSLIIFLIFLGGVMVLFIYIASLASNENFLVNYKSWIMASFLTLMILWLMLPLDKIPTIKTNLNILDMTYKMYSSQMFALTLTTMIYLLMTLVVVVEIIKFFKAPLRSCR